jgi:hypothetical protein
MKKAAVILILFGLALAGWASTYDGIYIQGRIFNGTSPLEGTADIGVRIVASGTSVSYWSKTYSGTAVNNGIFSLYLSDTSGTFAALDWSLEYDILFTVNGTPLPAQKLVAVPYTFMARQIYGGTVEASGLAAKRSGTGLAPEVRMAYQSSATDEAVAAWIGRDAVGKLGVEDKKITVTNYYGAFAEGRDYGIYADSTGQAVYAASQASAESFASALETSGGVPGQYGVGARINGPLKISRVAHTTTSGGLFGGPTLLIESTAGASGTATLNPGNASVSVSNSLIRKDSTLIYFQILSSGAGQKAWITNLSNGSLRFNREGTPGTMNIGYLLVN